MSVTLADLADLPIWVAWQGEPPEKPGGQPRKVPYCARGYKASTTKSADWTSRAAAEARAAALPRPCATGGVGTVLAPVDDDLYLCGIDLDTCFANGRLADWAAEVVKRFRSYTEVSPSGTGAKVFFRMKSADRERVLTDLRAFGNPEREGIKWARESREDHPPAIELYLGRRFFTVTGERIEGSPEEIACVGLEEMHWLIQQAGPAFRKRDDTRSGRAFRAALTFAKGRSGDYEEVRDELLEALNADREIAAWVNEKGLAAGERELRRIWEKARRDDPIRAWEINLGAPYDTAELMLSAKFATEDGRRILHHHRDGYYRYNGAAYPEVDDAEIRHLAYGFLNQCRTRTLDKQTKEWVEVPVKPNTRLVNELLDALRSAAFLSGEFAAPAWLEETADLEPRDILSCANGLLHLPSRQLMPHTPAFFTHNALDYPFVAGAPEPAAWLAFLGQLWPDDGPSIETLQEIFGYMLVADTSQQKMFMLVGARRSGKGTIGRVLARMVGGPPNVAAPTLAALGTNFGLAPLIGKRVGIISDARLGGRSDIAAITERLLSISGEDNLTIDRKHREAWTGSLGVRFMVLTNELPRFNDASGALVSRFIVLVTSQSFLGREDPGLTDKLLAELPGILNWSISGWVRLRKRGHFLQPASGLEAVTVMEALSSPIKAFADDCLTIHPNLEAAPGDLYWAWQQWCEQNGRERAGTIQLFGRNLRATFPQLKMTQPRDGAEDRVRRYTGVGLKKPVPQVDFGRID